MSKLALVTGGTGKTGSRLVQRLRERGWQARSASRVTGQEGDPHHVKFDWFDETTHARAIEGVDAAYLVPPIGSAEPIKAMRPFIEAAVRGGVRRFVLLSSSMIEEGGPLTGEVHRFLREHVPEFAVLRPSWFMENFSGQHAPSIVHEDAVYSATDAGLVPFIAVEDIAEAALHGLIEHTPPNKDAILTGPRAISYDEVATIIGAARGRPVRHIRLSAEAMTARFEKFGVPPEFATVLANLDRAIAAGAEARTTGEVERITGRAPMSFETFARNHAGVWRSWPRP